MHTHRKAPGLASYKRCALYVRTYACMHAKGIIVIHRQRQRTMIALCMALTTDIDSS